MSKQPTQSPDTRRESTKKKEDSNQSHDPQDRMKNPAALEHEQSNEPGGEESKHGRKQKGNVDDT